MKKITILGVYYFYQITRPIVFVFNSELMHDVMSGMGDLVGKIRPISDLLGLLLRLRDDSLTQSVSGIKFSNPIGLSAGYDYNASLTQTLPSLGFGFGTIGTITNNSYEGNPKPRLARLPKSKSLMVYKGFKNKGIDYILNKLEKKRFDIPIGLSIGATNVEYESHHLAMKDILQSFIKAEKKKLNFSYYELNISCPNIKEGADFYDPQNLNSLLGSVTKLKLSIPLFIKMPIGITGESALEMLKVISTFPVTGVIFGNLATDRNNKFLDKEEVKKWTKGGFSGKPTFERSNELIKLAYKNYGKKLVIIGCGGVFNGRDAYTKIKNGATLVQFVTALVFEGPAVAAKINLELVELLRRDGYKNVSEAVGKTKS